MFLKKKKHLLRDFLDHKTESRTWLELSFEEWLQSIFRHFFCCNIIDADIDFVAAVVVVDAAGIVVAIAVVFVVAVVLTVIDGFLNVWAVIVVVDVVAVL